MDVSRWMRLIEYVGFFFVYCDIERSEQRLSPIFEFIGILIDLETVLVEENILKKKFYRSEWTVKRIQSISLSIII